VVLADSLVDVGLRMPGAQYGLSQGRVLVSRQHRDGFSAAIRTDPALTVISVDTLLPIVRIKLGDASALKRLRALPFVSYVEPGRMVDRSSKPWQDIESGCSVGAYAGPGGSPLLPSGDVLPWNLHAMSVDLAWAKSKGLGVTVGLVDTGVDIDQNELKMPGFATGLPGRSIVRTQTDDSNSGGDDICGHGTRMAGVIAAPMNGMLTVGVAWGASLYSVRVDDDVILTNVEATRLGIRQASDHARIIAIALGTVAHYSSIADELSWNYYNRDRLFIVAAGTSACADGFTAVTFPGTLSTVTTVTALDPNGGIACNAHWGTAVDFAAYASQPTTGWAFWQGPAGIAGSSNAVGVISGIAALVWSRYPALTRSQLLTALISSAAPSGLRRSDIGWGAPNALCAVGALCLAWIDGPVLVESTGVYTFTAQQLRTAGPVTYQWSTGETTASIQRQIDVTYATQEHLQTLTVTITDQSDGTSRTVQKYITVRQPIPECPTCF
jgi:subtilisin family serine protease